MSQSTGRGFLTLHLTYRSSRKQTTQARQPRRPTGNRDMGALAGRRRTGSGSRRHLGYAVAARPAETPRSIYALRAAGRRLVPLQSWPLAWWPDGSLKWTAHTLAPDARTGGGPFEVVAQRAAPKGRERRHGDGTRVPASKSTRAIRVPHAARRRATSSPRSQRGGARGAARRQAGVAAAGWRRGRR